jgi:hypothetical protein
VTAAWVLAVALAAAADPVAELARLEAAAAAAPDGVAAQHALGLHLADVVRSADAIAPLRRALALGLSGPGADEARARIAWLLDESGQDAAAMAECRALLAAWPPDHPWRAPVADLQRRITDRHAALRGVTASETRAIIAVVLALGAMAGGFLLGRRAARGRSGAA